MADLFKILKEKQAPQTLTSAAKTAEQDEKEMPTFSPQINQAREVAQRTEELLATKGWCLWKCSVLNGDIIMVARDELATGYPEGYPVYTEAELEELFRDGVSQATLRLVHEAKKLAGAIVVGVEDAKDVKNRVD